MSGWSRTQASSLDSDPKRLRVAPTLLSVASTAICSDYHRLLRVRDALIPRPTCRVRLPNQRDKKHRN